MPEKIPCSQYDEQDHKCRSGFVRLHSTCWGGRTGCHACGHDNGGNRPDCMREDGPGPHLMNDNGLPLGWPKQ